MSSSELGYIVQRLRLLEDQAALNTLLNRYCWQVDLKNWEEFGSTYVEDARMDFEAFGEIRGRDQIVASTIQAETRFEAMQHSMTNREFDIQHTDDSRLGAVGDKATATAYLIFILTADTRNRSEDHLKMGGPYHFKFERVYDPETEDGKAWGAKGWRITHMKLRLGWTENDRLDTEGAFVKSKAPTFR